MKFLIKFSLVCIIAFSVTSCGGNSSKNEARIAELESQIAELKKSNTAVGTPNAENSSYISSTTSTSSSKSTDLTSFTGTYEFSDNINTWVLVIENDEDSTDKGTAYIYNKSDSEKVKCYGSWYKYSHMKYASASFSDKAPIVFFPGKETTLRYPYLNTEWIYANSSAADARNPELRLPIRKIK